MRIECPKDLKTDEWNACQIFAFNYAKSQGWFADIDKYQDIEKSETYGIGTYKEGLNIAIVTCRFWRDFYKKC